MRLTRRGKRAQAPAFWAPAASLGVSGASNSPPLRAQGGLSGQLLLSHHPTPLLRLPFPFLPCSAGAVSLICVAGERRFDLTYRV